MTTFEGGPANGQCLSLGRSPLLLRVTECNGKFDALDRLEDRPLPEEKLHAYVCTGYRGSAFVDGAKFRGRVNLATYKYVETGQPTDAEMRDEGLWLEWCLRTVTSK